MQTGAIRLVSHTPEHLRALIEGREAYEERFGLKLADGVREFLTGPEVSAEFLERLRNSPKPNPWRDGFAVVLDNVVIGVCSFVDEPADGIVEIAYGIAPAYEGRGYATTAARALLDYAWASGRVQKIRAHTLPEKNASTRVLAKCGFAHLGEINHPEDGLVWRWELTASR